MHTCVCVCLQPGAPGACGYLQVHVLIWSHPGDLGTHACLCVRVLVVMSGRPWCTCMFVCLCVLTWSYLGDRGAHVMFVCMHAYVLTSRTDMSSAEMGLPVLDAQSQDVFTSCPTPLQFHQAPRRRSNREGPAQAPEVIREPGMSTTGSGAKVGENGLHKKPDVRGGCMGVPGAGFAPVGPITRVVTSRQRDRSPLGSPTKTSSLDWGAHGQLCGLGGRESLENTACPPPTPPLSPDPGSIFTPGRGRSPLARPTVLPTHLSGEEGGCSSELVGLSGGHTPGDGEQRDSQAHLTCPSQRPRLP